jgi:hypothetical protein
MENDKLKPFEYDGNLSPDEKIKMVREILPRDNEGK